MASRRAVILMAWVFSMAISRNLWAQSSDQRDILARARQTYYSLKSEQMTQCQCRIMPNWNVLLSELGKSNPAALDNAVQRLSTIHFAVRVGADGNAKITHNDVPSNDEQDAKALSQIYDGMEQMITGFFMTWSAYMIVPALPEKEAEYRLEKLATGYRITYKEGPADITTDMGADFSIHRQKIVTTEFSSTISPHFQKIPKGYILTSYEATYDSGRASEATELQVAIGYQDVDGLQWPKLIKLNGTYGGTPYQVEVTFADCQATSGGQP